METWGRGGRGTSGVEREDMRWCWGWRWSLCLREAMAWQARRCSHGLIIVVVVAALELLFLLLFFFCSLLSFFFFFFFFFFLLLQKGFINKQICRNLEYDEIWNMMKSGIC
jgi:CHASE2 domain-containing sensor protein